MVVIKAAGKSAVTKLAVRQQVGIEDVKAQREKSSVTTVEFITPLQHVQREQ